MICRLRFINNHKCIVNKMSHYAMLGGILHKSYKRKDIMKKCFIISPIGEEGSEVRKSADEALQFIIEPACNAKGYEVIRADKISDAGMITQSIVEHILQDDIAIIDITGRNANVFYELAIRHSYGLPAIQITRDDTSEIPFDIHNVRTIQYDLSASGANKARQAIENAIDRIEEGSKTLNPVTQVSNILNLTPEHSEGEESVLSELLLKVNNIPDKLTQLENNIGIRFSQMLAAFSESLKVGTNLPQSNSLQDAMVQKFMEILMTNPTEGIAQMQNLMIAQKFMQESGLIKANEGQ